MSLDHSFEVSDDKSERPRIVHGPGRIFPQELMDEVFDHCEEQALWRLRGVSQSFCEHFSVASLAYLSEMQMRLRRAFSSAPLRLHQVANGKIATHTQGIDPRKTGPISYCSTLLHNFLTWPDMLMRWSWIYHCPTTSPLFTKRQLAHKARLKFVASC